QITTSASRLVPSANRTVWPSAPATAGRNRTPAAWEPAAAAADDELPAGHPAAQPGGDGNVHQPEPGEPPEQVLASMRCGSIGALVAIDRSTWRAAASSLAIWNPD